MKLIIRITFALALAGVLLFVAKMLLAQSFPMTPAQAQAAWDAFMKRDPVAAIEVQLTAKYGVTFAELDALVKAATVAAGNACAGRPDKADAQADGVVAKPKD